MEMLDLGERVLILRKNKKLTQKTFSNLIGTSQSYLSAIEKGKKNASLNFIISLVEITRVSSDWLLTGDGPMFLNEKQEKDWGVPKWLTNWWQKSDEAHQYWLKIQLTHILPNTK